MEDRPRRVRPVARAAPGPTAATASARLLAHLHLKERRDAAPRTTIAELYAYIDDLPRIGGVAPRTADSYRTAIRSLQDALGIGDSADLTNLDIEQVLERFRDATAGRFTRHSTNTYCASIRRVVGRFTGRLPEPTARGHPYRRRKVSPSMTLDYKIQLRPGQLIRFHLPADLTVAEAQRLAAFITSLPTSSSHAPSDTSHELS